MDSKRWKDLLNSGSKLAEAINYDAKVKKLKGNDIKQDVDQWKLGDVGYIWDKEVKNATGDPNPKATISVTTSGGDKKGVISLAVAQTAIRKGKRKK